VILNLFAISYFIFNKDKPAEAPATENNSSAILETGTESGKTAEETEPPAAATTAADTMAKPDNDITVLPTPPVTPVIKETPAKKPVATNTRPETPAISRKSDIIDYHELPESIKQQLPAIIISAHVYSSNPLQRSIVINNNFMEEGEYVIDGLILHEITTDGAVFNYQGTLFNYGVVSGWQ
jgi:general secretion pathway protein B